MAKAREIPGLRPDTTFRRAAALTVRIRAQELLDHSEGVLDTTDIERVHAMRVASRRLRAVLEIHAACFPKKLHRAALRDVKALADALGERRDPDVQLDALERFAADVGPEERPGVELFAATVRARQSEGNDVLAGALATMREHDLAGRLRALARAADPDAGPDAPLAEAAPEPEPVAPPRSTLAVVRAAPVAPVPAERPAGESRPAAGDGGPARGSWPGGWGSSS